MLHQYMKGQAKLVHVNKKSMYYHSFSGKISINMIIDYEESSKNFYLTYLTDFGP